MSELHIALVAEGPTDLVIIEAALKAVLPRPFVLTQRQPEATRPDMGGGWGGVFKWCKAFRERGAGAVENDPTLSHFDLLIVHLDADVADRGYADCGDAVASAAGQLPILPCARPCPPPSDTIDALRTVLLAWLGLNSATPKTVLCLPSKASESWLAGAILPDDHALLEGLECRPDLESRLAQLPKSQKVRKSLREYRSHAAAIVARWERIKRRCQQARIFEQAIREATPSQAD